MTAATSCVHDVDGVDDVNNVRCAANGARVFEEAC
jgi:hypothetical protein